MPIKLTPSSLAYWFDSGCPAAWKFDQEWESLENKEWAERGTLAHAMMDGQVARATVEDKFVLAFYDKLSEFYKASGWQPLFDLDQRPMNELKQRFRIAPGVDLSRRIDKAVVDTDGQNALVDWKTTPGYGWKAITDAGYELIYPQAHGFQSIGYLIPPPKEDWERLRLPKKFKWPKKIIYVVAPLRGPIQVLQYNWSQERYTNFVHATQVAIPSIKQKHFPKIQGKQCHDCRFKSLCYQTPGWETGYRKRDLTQHRSSSKGDAAAA